ncbi:MAG: amidase [Rhodothalassiaceae bacterium]
MATDRVRLTRRAVLGGGAALAGAGAAGVAFGQAAKESGIDESTVGQCSRMIDLALDDDEKAQIVATLDDQLEAIRAIRAVGFDNTEAPALGFDPVLPGHRPEAQSGGVQNAFARGAGTPGSAEDVAFAPLSQLSQWVRNRQIASIELTELYLERIARFGPLLRNFVTVTGDRAREQAARADAEIAEGRWRGPLHGIPYGLKDLVDTKDIRTTWGATPYKDRVATRDATIVRRLEEAGAVLIGKTTNGAIAYGDIWFDAVTRNPWNPREGSSGSSAGSASATAAGLCGFSIGTETLGSIVSPSTRNGATGLRPTYGRVPRTGAMALCWSLDKIGPICRSVLDTALVLEAINAPDPEDPGSRPHGFSWDAASRAEGMRVGYDPAWFEGGNDVDRAALETMRGLGVELVEMTLPAWPYGALLPQLEAEAAAAFQELTLSGRDDELRWQEDQAWPNTWRRVHFFPAVDLVQIDRFRRRVMHMMAERMKDLDAIISPNFAGWLLVITNYTGHPCLTLPAGFLDQPTRPAYGTAKEGDPRPIERVPQNITLWGPLYEERKLLTLGRALEERLGMAGARPPLERWLLSGPY